MAGFGNTTVIVNTKELDRISAKLNSSTDSVIRAMGFEVQGMTRNAIDAQGAIDTGAYWNSIEVLMPSGAKFRNSDPPADVEQDIPTPPEHAIHVGPTVNYAVYVEFGTKYVAARPSLIPSFEAVVSDYMSPDKWKIVVEGNYAGDINAIKQAAGL
jgi:hypothetical protein